MECISPILGMGQEKEKSYVGVALHAILLFMELRQSWTLEKIFNFLDRRKQSLLHRFLYQSTNISQ